jgi:hypothetical protein
MYMARARAALLKWFPCPRLCSVFLQ